MRLIDADEFWKLVKSFRDTLPEETSKRKFICNAILLALMDEKETPTIDATPVVRCRECIHYEMGVCMKIYDDGAASSYAWQDRNPDDFCSCGERKEGAD